MTDASVVGYAVYVAAIVLPGYGLGELFGRWNSGDSIVRRAGYAVGYGLAIDTVVFAARTLGAKVGPLQFIGAEPAVVYFMVLLGIAFLATSYLKRRRFEGVAKPTVSDVSVLVGVAIVAVVVLMQFQKFPVFPPFYNPDYRADVIQPNALIAGTEVSFPRMLVYGGAYYQTAMAFLATGSSNMLTAEVAMSLLGVLSPFVVYAAAERILVSKRSAALAALIYSLTGTVWAQMIFSDGLFPNFVGILLMLILLVTFLDFAEDVRSKPLWVVSGVVLVALYFSHFSALDVLGSMVLFSALMFIFKAPGARRTMGAALLFVAPGAIGGALMSGTFLRIITISYRSGQYQPLTTALSNALSFAPSIAYLVFDMQDDLGFVLMTFLLAVAIYRGTRSKDRAIALPSVWFVATLAAAPQDYAAWRFALVAIIPFIFLAAYGLDALLPKARTSKGRRLREGDPYRLKVAAIGILLLTPIVATSWNSTLVQGLVQQVGPYNQLQNQEHDAMLWLGQNTPSGTRVLSVTDPIFLFTEVYVGRNCTYQYFGNETQAIGYAKQNGIGYLVVTHYNVYFDPVTPASNAADPSLPWYTYGATGGTTLVYNNTDVKVFQLGIAP